MIVVLLEHDRGVFDDASLEALTTARQLGSVLGVGVHAAALVADGAVATALAEHAARFGAASTIAVTHPMLADYGPEAWGEALGQASASVGATVILATGTDRGNEVLAHLAARRDISMTANCVEIKVSTDSPEVHVVRSRWGGSLLEEATVTGTVRALSVAHHSVEPVPAPAATSALVTEFIPTLDVSLARTVVVDRQLRDNSGGATLATARVVVGGGRGVGSADGFSVLEDLATVLGGKVGCSRAVTNNGWRNHADQVGQTGTRIAPEIYLACGISGAIQHWVGAMASKKILAINTDPEANMVSRADYAVIGDLHQVVPAIAAEVRRRRSE
jgi:electron transfer flavoprotein alpha subunit